MNAYWSFVPYMNIQVHRLDRESSGILLMGRTKESASYLQQLFTNVNIAKTSYLVLTLIHLIVFVMIIMSLYRFIVICEVAISAMHVTRTISG